VERADRPGTMLAVVRGGTVGEASDLRSTFNARRAHGVHAEGVTRSRLRRHRDLGIGDQRAQAGEARSASLYLCHLECRAEQMFRACHQSRRLE